MVDAPAGGVGDPPLPVGGNGPAQMVSGRHYAVAAHTPDPAPSPKKESTGATLAKLAIILGISIPLTAITAAELGLRGLLVVWVGIVLVAAFALLPERFRRP